MYKFSGSISKPENPSGTYFVMVVLLLLRLRVQLYSFWNAVRIAAHSSNSDMTSATACVYSLCRLHAAAAAALKVYIFGIQWLSSAHCGNTHFAFTSYEVCAQRQHRLNLSFCRTASICACICNRMPFAHGCLDVAGHPDLATIPLGGCEPDQAVRSPCSKAAA